VTIFDLLDRLAFLRGFPSVAIVLAAAFLALALWDYRPALVALVVVYLVGGLLFVDLLDPRLAVVYTLSGVFATLILVVTAWQVNWGRPPEDLTPEEVARLAYARRVRLGPLNVPAVTLLRVLAAAAALVAAYWLWRSGPGLLAVVPPDRDHVRLAVLGLLGLGLAGLATSAEPFPAGLGLLIFLLGFELFMSVVQQSIAMAIALAAFNLLVALVVSYLAQARAVPQDALE
jgi:hypothetical protein